MTEVIKGVLVTSMVSDVVDPYCPTDIPTLVKPNSSGRYRCIVLSFKGPYSAGCYL